MTEQETAARIVGIRRAVRTMITHALADDMVSSGIIAHNLSQTPDLAADALMELGEALDVALHGYAAGSGRDVNQVWRVICAQLADGDTKAATSYFDA